MLAILSAALFSTIALLATALFALLAQLNGFRSEVAAEFTSLRGEFADFRSDLARIEQKLDDHIAFPHPTG